MAKHKTKKEWIKLFIKYEKDSCIPKEFLSKVNFKDGSNAKAKSQRTENFKLASAKRRFLKTYKIWKLLDNKFMAIKKETRGAKPKRDIEGFVDKLTKEELKEIARVHIRQNEKTKDKKARYKNFTIIKMAFILNVHRSTLYKKKKTRVYKYDYAKEIITNKFHEYHGIYGSGRLAIALLSDGLAISDRTLRHYMVRWNLVSKTRQSKRTGESKNTKVTYLDLVKRNFNPSKDKALATDVTYISANEKQNNVYLSIAISHKTKLIESYSLSTINDSNLVIETLNSLARTSFLFHSDHGAQYSSSEVQSKLKHCGGITSMGRVGNSLDNREAEYFFGCLKGEYLNSIKTWKMKIEEIKKHVDWYINWYNTKRIQSRLQWKTPTEVSEFAI